MLGPLGVHLLSSVATRGKIPGDHCRRPRLDEIVCQRGTPISKYSRPSAAPSPAGATLTLYVYIQVLRAAALPYCPDCPAGARAGSLLDGRTNPCRFHHPRPQLPAPPRLFSVAWDWPAKTGTPTFPVHSVTLKLRKASPALLCLPGPPVCGKVLRCCRAVAPDRSVRIATYTSTSWKLAAAACASLLSSPSPSLPLRGPTLCCLRKRERGGKPSASR